MKVVKVDALEGGEYLAAPVVTQDGQMLFYEGTCVHPAQIERLKDHAIEAVKIFDSELSTGKSKEIIREEIQADCQETIKGILDNYVCRDDGSLEEIAQTAQTIITEVFQRDEVAERVYDIKERSADLYDHAITVSALSVITGVKMNMEQTSLYSIGVGALLHDLGLKYISLDYRNVDTNTFNPEMLFEFKKHTVYGFSSVEREKWMSSSAKKIILFHHEKLNGTGYPLKQTTIPPEVRIVSVCDAFDDMICGIGFRQVHVSDAIDFIKTHKDTYFDGRVVDIFLQFVAVYPVGTVVLTSLGEKAVVVRQNEHYTDCPVIRLLKDPSGKDYEQEKEIDLAANRKIRIEKVIES